MISIKSLSKLISSAVMSMSKPNWLILISFISTHIILICIVGVIRFFFITCLISVSFLSIIIHIFILRLIFKCSHSCLENSLTFLFQFEEYCFSLIFASGPLFARFFFAGFKHLFLLSLSLIIALAFTKK